MEKSRSLNNLINIGNLLSLSSTIIHTKILNDLDGFDESNKIITAEDYFMDKISKNEL